MAETGTFALRAFALGYWILSVGSFDGACLEGWNKPRLVFLMSLTGVLCGAASLTVLRPWLGPVDGVALAVSLCMAGIGVLHTTAWLRTSKFTARRYATRMLRPVAEMALFGVMMAIAARPFIHGRVMGFACIPAAAGAMALVGLWRGFDATERRSMFERIGVRWGKTQNA
jgi:O-antigen/teichoic acid export membrane protein